MKPRFRALVVPVAIVVSTVCVVSCGIGSRTTSTTQTTMTPEGERDSQGVSVSLASSPHEVALTRARQAARDGKWDDAAQQFRRLADTVEAGPEMRTAALMDLGSLHRNVLNPTRDPELAAQSYERLIEEFPDSPLRADAEAELERLRAP